MINLPMGLFACMLRVVKGMAVGLVLFGRVDRSLMMPGFEKWDKG